MIGKASSGSEFSDTGKPRGWLRLKFIVPVVAMMLGLMIAVTLAVSYFNSQTQHRSLIHERLFQIRAIAQNALDSQIEVDSNAIRSIILPLVKDPQLAALFRARERGALLAYIQPLYQQLNRQFDITHFYFHLPDRVNLLRVHAPDRHGDMINRQTALVAENTNHVSAGVEMGVLGTLSLRVVYPWRDSETGELIGYLELGKEIDRVLDQLQTMLGTDAYLLLHKSMLDAEKWKDGMAVLGRASSWDRYPDVVVLATKERFAKEHLNIFGDHKLLHEADLPEIEVNERTYHPAVIPVWDMGGKNVGDLVLLVDVSFQKAAARNTVVAALLAVLLAGIPLLIFFAHQARSLQARLDENERELSNRASIDALTGLWNRRTFDERLREETLRAVRYEHSLSLLMIDIDHFKRINDTYGHLEGDKVLQGLANRLRARVRATDVVCRYGGEEMVILLPNTDLEQAAALAEVVRHSMADQDFVLGAGRSKETITISIGVAAYSQRFVSPEAFVQAADEALYKAKGAGRNRVMVAETVAEQ